MTIAERVASRYLSAAGKDWKGLFAFTTSKVVAEAMRQWGEHKLAEWDKEKFYKLGGAKAIVAHVIKQAQTGRVREWLEGIIALPQTYIRLTPTITYRGGTLEVKFELTPLERTRDDDVEAVKKSIETTLKRVGVKWESHDWHEAAEGWWSLAYECKLKWKVPAETIVRKSIGLRVNNVGRDHRRVTWKGK